MNIEIAKNIIDILLVLDIMIATFSTELLLMKKFNIHIF